MMLTPLETMLAGGLISLITALVVRVWMGNQYVGRKECQSRSATLLSLDRDVRLTSAMLRAVISHMPGLTPEQREKILNMKPPSGKE